MYTPALPTKSVNPGFFLDKWLNLYMKFYSSFDQLKMEGDVQYSIKAFPSMGSYPYKLEHSAEEIGSFFFNECYYGNLNLSHYYISSGCNLDKIVAEIWRSSDRGTRAFHVH